MKKKRRRKEKTEKQRNKSYLGRRRAYKVPRTGGFFIEDEERESGVAYLGSGRGEAVGGEWAKNIDRRGCKLAIFVQRPEAAAAFSARSSWSVRKRAPRYTITTHNPFV